MSLLDLFRSRRAERTRSAVDVYWSELQRQAEGDDLDERDGEAVAEAFEEAATTLGKSNDDVATDLELVREEQGLNPDTIERDAAAALRARETKIAAASAKRLAFDEAERAWQAAEGEVTNSMAPLVAANERRDRASVLRRMLKERGRPENLNTKELAR